MKWNDKIALEPSPWRRLFSVLPGEVLYLLGAPVFIAFTALTLLFWACFDAARFWVKFIRALLGDHYQETWRILRGVRRSTHE